MARQDRGCLLAGGLERAARVTEEAQGETLTSFWHVLHSIVELVEIS